MYVELFVKPGCPLCDEARALLADARRAFALELVERDITAEPGLFDALRYSVPVVAVEGVASLRLRFGAADVERVLQAAGAPPAR